MSQGQNCLNSIQQDDLIFGFYIVLMPKNVSKIPFWKRSFCCLVILNKKSNFFFHFDYVQILLQSYGKKMIRKRLTEDLSDLALIWSKSNHRMVKVFRSQH